MILLALTLGFLGSLHCMGMCGPLALGVMHFGPKALSAQWAHMLLYNAGRILAYILLGILAGTVGKAFFELGIQNFLTIFLGILMVALFLYSVSLEQFLLRSATFSILRNRMQAKLQSWMTAQGERPYVLGFANGLLPCGLVYLALAGALSQADLFDAALFMSLFGIGTLPALLLIMSGGMWIRSRIRPAWARVFPYLQLIMGVVLIYRGLSIGLPLDLDLFMALKDPVMCH